MLSSFGVSFTLNSLFIPISVHCLVKVLIVDQAIFSCLFLCFCQKCISPIKSFGLDFGLDFYALLSIEFFFLFQFNYFSADASLYWRLTVGFSRIFRCRETKSVVLMRGVLVLRNSFMLAVTLNLSCGIIRRKHTAISTGLMYLDCSGVTTENSAICVFFLIRYGDSVLLVCLTETLLSNTVDIEWEISRLAVSVNFSTGVTVPVVFHYEG